MKTHTETVTLELEIPDGYRCIDYRPPVTGEYYLREDGTVYKATFDRRCTGDDYPILEKVHKGPVIEYVLKCVGSQFERYNSPTPDSWEFVETITDPVLKYTIDGKLYDLIRFNTPATSCIGLGHWNDGPSS